MPTISVIVPVYKVEPYIHQCIDSILAQTYTDFELILVDDGSPDNCGMICDEYAKQDDRIRVIHQENQGLSAARNAGIDIAKGECLTFIDSDDLWEPDKLEKQMALLLKNPEAALVFTGSAFIDAQGNRIAHILHVPEKINRKKLLGQNVISCSSVLIRKELMKEFPMPEEDGIHEDFATWLAILNKIPYAYGVDEPLLIYRRSATSKSGQKSKSAQMNWRTYIRAGIPLGARVIAMMKYTVNGLEKYFMLWAKRKK